MLRTDKVFPYGPNSTDERQQNNLNAGYVSALSIGADGTIYVADQINLEVSMINLRFSKVAPILNLALSLYIFR